MIQAPEEAWKQLTAELSERDSQIASLNQAVSERDSQIASLNQAVSERDSQIASLNQAVSERDSQVASLNQAVSERDSQVASLNQAVSERDSQIASLNQAVSERDSQIASLNQAVSERDSQVASLNQAVSERDSQVASLNQAVSERDSQIASLNQAVSERDSQIASLNQAVSERDSQVASLNQAVSERDSQIASLNQAVSEREHCIRAILDSRSWKLTGPLRKTVELTRYLFSRIHLLMRAFIVHASKLEVVPLAIARWGAVDLSRRVYRVFRVSSVRGVLRRIESFQSLLVHEVPCKEIYQNHPRQAQAFSRTEQGPEHPKPKVAYVVNQHDLMTQVYRVLNYAEALAAHGYSCEFLRDHEVGPDTDIDADILVLNRIVWCENIDALIRRFRETGRPIIFDIDDFVFDPDQIHLLRATAQCGDADRERIRSFLQRTEKTMRACDFVTVTTFALKKEVEKRGLPAFVLPNNNGLAQAQLAKNISAKKAPNGGPVRIGYFSGTKTHEEDFMQCAESLGRVLRENPDAELLIVGQLDLPPALAEMESRIQYRPLMPHQEMLVELSKIDINLAPLELGNIFTDCKSELKIFEAALFGIPTIASPTSTFAAVIENGKTGYLAATPEDWYAALTELVRDHGLRHRIGVAAREIIATRYAITTTVEEAKTIYDAAISGRLRRRPECSLTPVVDAGPPLITIVSVLYRKAREVRYFLEALRRQDFPGRYEVLLVDDRSPDDSVAVVQDFKKWAACSPDSNARMDIRILSNQANIGNCGSRNAAIRKARADVVIVVDADCMFTRSFLSAHFAAHMKGDCDVAIGPINIETGDAPPLSVLGRHEATSVLAENENLPQDPTNLDSFVNCITRNFSIQRSFIEKSFKESLFDEAFSYSADPQSGFGWEDVEMGYRVYRARGCSQLNES
ncbi:MAG: glycosyltransferase [Sulfuritalea sp.]|nr:glycosyltransferase [Sulfuritalea sp.]